MKTIRDPVHNLIQFSEKDESIILRLIDTPEFQRLHHIRQLGLSFLTYPGATHTRFSHSLGVTHLMRRFLDQLTTRAREQDEQDLKAALKDGRMLALAGALLHDVGHGPFSHALEQVTQIRHERLSRAIITGPTRIREYLEAWASGFSEEVADLIGRTHANRAVVKLLSSQLDVDRLDYLLRDALMSGARYGALDLEWLIHTLRMGEVDNPDGTKSTEVGLDLNKGLSLAEDFMMARFYMYNHVYLHKTTRAAELMVRHVLLRAYELTIDGEKLLPPALAELIVHRDAPEEVIEAYLTLTDATLWSHFFAWQEHPDPVLSYLSRGLIGRKLYKSVPYPEHLSPATIYELQVEAAKVGERLGLQLPAKYALFFDDESSMAYKDPYILGSSRMRHRTFKGVPARQSHEVLTPERPASQPEITQGEDEATEAVYLFDREGKAVELSEASNLIQFLRGKALRLRRLYVPEALRDWLKGRLENMA
ncbi:MAG: HD domain-containing protein [Candidatus Carbobacillus altaicus]|nr:HD domain-containing protein [Candidatus Carbobacillus altaicus]